MFWRSRLLRSTLGLSFARGTSGMLLVLATVVFARAAGAAELGLVGLALTVGVYASVVADSGIPQYLLPALARLPREGWASLWADVVRFQRRTAVPYALVYVVPVALLTGGELRWTLLATLPWWLLLRMNGAMRSVFVVAESVTAEAVATIADGAATVAAVLVVGAVHPTAPLGVLTLSLGALVGLVMRARGLRRLGVTGGEARRGALDLGREALPFNGFTVLTNLYMRIDVIVLSILQNTRAIGLYQPPVRFSTALLIIPDSLASLLLGRAARHPGQRDVHMRQEQLLAIGFPIGLALVGVIAVLGRPLLGALYGSDFRAAAPALTLMTATVPVAFLAAVNGNALTAVGRQGTRLLCLALASVVAVGCGIPAIAHWSYTGAAGVSLLNEIVLAAAYAVSIWLTVGRDAILLPRPHGLRVALQSR
jgi:O-antigen/teichoic acid export membrane protein